MGKRIARAIAGVSFTAIIPTVVGMMWPSIPHSLGYTLIVLWVLIGAGALIYAHRADRSAARNRDVGVREAIAYIAARTWGADLQAAAEAYEGDWGELASNFFQAARDEKVPVWGKTGRYAYFEPIPPEHWRDHDVDLMALMFDRTARSKARSHLSSPVAFDDLHTSRAAVEAIWPKLKRRWSIRLVREPAKAS